MTNGRHHHSNTTENLKSPTVQPTLTESQRVLRAVGGTRGTLTPAPAATTTRKLQPARPAKTV